MLYVTYQIKPTSYVTAVTGRETEYHAIGCRDYDRAVAIASDVYSLDGVTYVRINRCGRLRHKDKVKITSGDEYFH